MDGIGGGMTGLVVFLGAAARAAPRFAAEERGGFRRDWIGWHNDSVGIVFGCNRDSMSL